MKWFVVLFFSLLGRNSYSQNTILGISANYSYQLPFGDFSNKYSANNNVGITFGIKTNKNFTFGIEGSFIFGSSYKNTEPLGSIVTSGGFVLGKDGSVEYPSFEGRGGNFIAEIGKIIPIDKNNLNSGIHIKIGGGYFFHKAYLGIDPLSIPQLNEIYQQGYDHAEAGWSFNPYLGYTHYGKQKLFNFSLGVQSIFSFTKSQRNWDFVSNTSIKDATYSNIQIGPKATFTIPIYKSTKKELKNQFYYN